MTTVTSGPWDGVYNASDRSDAYKKKLYAASNMYLPQGKSSWAMRPPFQLKQAAGTLGSILNRYGRLVYEHVGLDGTVFRFVFVGDHIYRWDGGTTYTNVTPAAYTGATTKMYALTFGDNLVVCEDGQKPWYVASSGCGATPLVVTTIQIDSVPTAWTTYGNPVVFDGRLFFTVGSKGGSSSFRDTIVWSEIETPGTGYQQTGYSNFWELFQTDSHPIYGLAATEISLVVFRESSILNVTGKTDTTFTANATRESIEGIGTTSPASILVHDGIVWFLDALGRQYRYQPGGSPEPLWPQMADTVGAEFAGAAGVIADASLNASLACYLPGLQLVLSATYSGGVSGTYDASAATILHVFDAASGTYYGTWDVDGQKLIHAFGVCRNANSRTTLVVLGESVTANNSSIATSGAVWVQVPIQEMIGSTSWADPAGVPSASVTTHHLGRSEDATWTFDQLTVRAVTTSANSAGRTLPLTYYTPNGSSTAPTAVLTQPPSQPVNSATTGYQGEARAVWGLGSSAHAVRWLMAVVGVPTTSQTVQPFQPTSVTLRGVPSPAGPTAT